MSRQNSFSLSKSHVILHVEPTEGALTDRGSLGGLDSEGGVEQKEEVPRKAMRKRAAKAETRGKASGSGTLGTAGAAVQFKELLRKRYLCAIRDVKGRVCEVGLPVVVVALGCLLRAHVCA